MYNVNLPNGDVFRESDTYQAGNKAIIAKIKENKFKIGMTICYDLRFPNLYQDLAVNGADVIVVPSAFSNLTGPVHWHTLLKARAIETGSFIIAPAQTGKHQCGRVSYGHSLIVSPWGKVLKDAKKTVGIIHTNVNLEEVRKVRKSIPSLISIEVTFNLALQYQTLLIRYLITSISSSNLSSNDSKDPGINCSSSVSKVNVGKPITP